MSMISTALIHALADDPPRTLPPLPRAPPHVGPKLILFIASHIKNEDRLAKVKRCLRSVAEQAQPGLWAVFISWSVSNEDLRSRAKNEVFDNNFVWEAASTIRAEDVKPMALPAGLPADMLKVAAKVNESERARTRMESLSFGLHVFERKTPLSQFEHFASLVTEARSVLGADDGSPSASGGKDAFEEAWVMFTDDDDILHPERCLAYKEAVVAVPDNIHAVAASWVARPVKTEADVENAADVERLVAQGRVMRTPRETIEEEGRAVTKGEGGWDEYWNYSLRLATLQRFFDDTLSSPTARACKYADLCLYHYIRNSVPTVRFHAAKSLRFDERWCHYYDKPVKPTEAHGNGSESSGVTSLPVDEERAKVVRDQMEQIADGVSRQISQGPAPPNGDAIVSNLRLFLDKIERFEKAESFTGSDVLLPELADKEYTALGDTPVVQAFKRSAPKSMSHPMVLVLAQVRSIVELFCAQWVGAPHMPPAKVLLEQIVQVILVDQLVSLGVQEHVAAILHLIVTEPVLKDVSEMFGLPIAKGLRSTVSLPT